jgi:hypothetical protein
LRKALEGERERVRRGNAIRENGNYFHELLEYLFRFSCVDKMRAGKSRFSLTFSKSINCYYLPSLLVTARSFSSHRTKIEITSF